jgi:molybdate transport system substrate-binding protein
MSQTFEKTSNCKITVNSAGSSTLYQQITSGSPCDVFMSADFKWANQLNTSNLLYDNNYKNFTSNTLIVILPRDNPKNITSLLDLTKPGVKVVMPDPSIPSGSYANSTLNKIDKTWGNSSSSQYLGPDWQNYRAKFTANVVSYELQVEDVIGKVASGLGTADAGIAFVSDATAQGSNLQYIPIPSSVNTRGVYSICIMNTSTQTDLATKFMNYWLSNEGQTLLSANGFGT